MRRAHPVAMEITHLAHQLWGYHLVTRDGPVGRVRDLYVDDRRWVVRYLVVELRHALASRRVLISPVCVRAVDTDARCLEVSLVREQVRHAPDVDDDRPVSRQHEIALHEYYGIPFYWTDEDPAAAQPADPHLRSVRAVRGYSVIGRDAAIGHVEDFVIDVVGWRVSGMVVARRHWLSGPRHTLAVADITRISWLGKAVYVDTGALDRVGQPA
jgi:uncharacterized protein YrrD